MGIVKVQCVRRKWGSWYERVEGQLANEGTMDGNFPSLPSAHKKVCSSGPEIFSKLSNLVSSQAASLWTPRRQTVAWILGQNAFPPSVR